MSNIILSVYMTHHTQVHLSFDEQRLTRMLSILPAIHVWTIYTKKSNSDENNDWNFRAIKLTNMSIQVMGLAYENHFVEKIEEHVFEQISTTRHICEIQEEKNNTATTLTVRLSFTLHFIRSFYQSRAFILLFCQSHVSRSLTS